MRFAQKRHDVPILACCLGEGSKLEQDLISTGRVRCYLDGHYEVFSQESKEGKGEVALRGDYIKLDAQGFPYPNKRADFKNSCKAIGENLYQQYSEPVQVWFWGEPLCEFISFLFKNRRIELDKDSTEQFFRANLWGAPLSAPRDSAVIAYSVNRDKAGEVVDVDFNFVVKSEFERTYEWC